ncbi:MAG: CPBP family intramembrane metalloprotease [Anaerolineaceae bacterium]|nr:CPBP family intramembrane metalloprotease [Anaerolineaceae bacterium]
MLQQILLFMVEFAGVVAVTILLALSPVFRRRRPLLFAYPRREGLVALGVFVASAAILTGLALRFPQNPIDPATPAHLFGQVGAVTVFRFTSTQLSRQIFLALAVALPALLLLLVRRQPMLSAGLPRPTMRAGIQLGLGLALISLFLGNKTNAILNGLNLDQWTYLGAMLAAGLAVEFVFRGFIQLRLVAWLGPVWGWIAASALYAGGQIPQKLLVEHNTLPELGASLALLFGFGLLLGWIMRKSGNVLAPGIYHVFHNWLVVL